MIEEICDGSILEELDGLCSVVYRDLTADLALEMERKNNYIFDVR